MYSKALKMQMHMNEMYKALKTVHVLTFDH